MRYPLLALLAGLLLAAGCAHGPAEPPEVRAVRDTQRIYDLMRDGNWKELWNYVHPDVKAPITYGYFAESYANLPYTIVQAKAMSAEKLSTPWGIGKQYDDVYRVTVTVDYSGVQPDYGPMPEDAYVVEVDGRFRYFPSLIALVRLPRDNKSNSPAARAGKDAQQILDLERDGQWDQLWEYVHPDEQASMTYDQFYAESSAISGAPAREVQWVWRLDTPWRASATGKEYDNVYLATFMVLPPDGTGVILEMHLVEVEGRFRVFLGPPTPRLGLGSAGIPECCQSLACCQRVE
jgi:hypothetical protein